ncbi:2-keto-4-pentenoate hydratase [Noviherbaspirillum sp. ST9]|uniref:2-keto-4-pentenoate hydratase n=1 Tax=Noviherbaspirillum sp. ST9 TaxID=3401606 RepID=UPI003B588EFC
MTPEALLAHIDHGCLWPNAPGEVGGSDLAAAYAQSLEVRRMRIARGERPAGYKVGFTNRLIWERYNVYAPIWGTVWNTTLQLCDGHDTLSIANTCQPRVEPEAVFGMRATPKQGADLDALFDAIDWVAPGLEIVQSHLPGWKFASGDAVADNSLHARLLVGRRFPVRELAASATELDRILAQSTVELLKADNVVESGRGANVLDGPLRALLHFLVELRRFPDAGDLQAGDVVTTGTWTDAWSIQPEETWTARFSAPLGALSVTLE